MPLVVQLAGFKWEPGEGLECQGEGLPAFCNGIWISGSSQQQGLLAAGKGESRPEKKFFSKKVVKEIKRISAGSLLDFPEVLDQPGVIFALQVGLAEARVEQAFQLRGVEKVSQARPQVFRFGVSNDAGRCPTGELVASLKLIGLQGALEKSNGDKREKGRTKSWDIGHVDFRFGVVVVKLNAFKFTESS